MGHQLSRQKDLYDEKVHGQPFEPGQLVWLHSPAVRRGQSRKLHCPWTGPFRVTHKISEATYRVQNTQSRRHRLIDHFNRLKRCPDNMRVSADSIPPQVTCHDTPSLPPPPGTNLEILDDDSVIPRYPQRRRTAPNYYQPIVVTYLYT